MRTVRATMRSILLAAAACWCAACGGPSAPEDQGGGAVLTEERPAAMAAPGRLELRDLAFKRASDVDAPVEPYVPGLMYGGWFDATGEIVGPVGTAPRGRALTKGRLELRNRAFFRFDDARPKSPPYVEGWRDDDTGGFFPLGPVVWRLP
jgi:hypothetical protein